MSKRKSGGSRKGSSFERDICRRLTEWWTGDPEHDVIFWRTSQSGGRATNRRKLNKSTTKSHCGDITAIDPLGKPLTDRITFELKRGYNRANIHDLLDRTKTAAFQTYEVWIAQATMAGQEAKTPYWMLIHHRTRRDPVVLMPTLLFLELDGVRVFKGPTIELQAPESKAPDVTMVRLEDFLRSFTPDSIRSLSCADD